jgi:beta-glucanase (GH16 family)
VPVVLRARRVWLALAAAIAVALLGAFFVPRIIDSPSSPPPSPQGPPGTWRNVLDDEFSGASLNGSWWQPDRYGTTGGDAPFNPSQEGAWFSPGNVAVSGGTLSLTIRSDPRTLLGRDYPYSSGMVQSPPDATIGPGSYVEARIEVPTCDGCWPAFWLDPSKGSPPEIDGFEFFGTGDPAQSRPSFNYWPPDGGSRGSAAYGNPEVDYRGAYHTYGILWTKNAITPYVDGVAYPQVGVTSDITQEKLAIIINLSVMAGHQPAAGSQMRVDWVRVWSQS